MTLILLKVLRGKILGYLQSKYDNADIDELLSMCTLIPDYIEGSSAIVKDQLAREGVEIIDEKINEPTNSSLPVIELTGLLDYWSCPVSITGC